ncbi:DNA internalization-related competence protein ComEC/Rec2 [Fructobacillus sp. M1-13]|uniref:DNA internalization-related competence protein ComEC/Rec2 n=1 Tax=Fructobacillus papyriferae TaxID=2713171 RepID=A0ABS5QSI0_9LACO|nr:DNA internalization-related competence protein ComEC/Rec2 [Fructobacillus papyriferae]MBS9334917.1 DNA internalization-related competence protein ComEC/Rec2 [Fructobacillus papyriferae]MCD2159599.1 DNA internalization-related competence protein ComEC/Rec2 [Fructobacillus papyriferae]
MRTRHFHFLLALVFAALSLVINRPNALTVTLMVGMTLLSLTLGFGKKLRLFWTLCLPFVLYLQVGHGHLEKQALRPASQGQERLLVHADQLKIAEDGRIRGQGKTARGEKLLFSYAAKDQADVDRWAQLSGTYWLFGQADKTPIMGPTNDYQFDFRAYWQSQKVTHTLCFKEVAIQPADAQNPWQALLFACHRAHAAAERWTDRLPNPLRDYALSLILASKGSQLYDNNPMIAELGLIHLFALSGLHVAFLTRFLREGFLLARISREVGDGLLAFFLPLFFLFTGLPAVLFRAMLSGEMKLFGRNFRLRIDPIKSWSWSLIGSLIVYPQLLLTMGGQLSFALTLAVIISQGSNIWQRGLFLSLVTFPFILATQYSWNLWQTLANILAVPVFTVVVLPVTLVGYFACWIPGVCPITNTIIQLFDKAVALAGALPGKIVIGALSWPVLVLLFLLPFFALGAKKSSKKLAIATWLFLLLGNSAFVHWPKQGEWTTFDIGQGDAAVLIEPRHKTITMIDTGGKVQFGPRPHYSTGRPTDTRPKVVQNKALKQQEGLARSVIVPYLHAKGIAHINTLALSHQDQDHIGDSRVILQNFKVDQLVIPAGMRSLPAFQRKIQPYLQKTKVIEATDQTKVPNCPLQILYPFAAGLAGNDDSLAWGGRLGGQTIYTAGDLDQSGETKILTKYPEFVPDIVKFGHHGSKTATDPKVFAQWQPTIGLISAGRNSRYGHPHQEVLDVAKEEKMIVYNTQSQGMLRYVYQEKHGHFEVSYHDPAGPKRTN